MVFQFSISVVLIICITVVYKQLWYINNKDLGLNKENILVLPFNSQYVSKYDAIKDELLRNPNIKYVSGMSNLPTNINSRVGMNWEGNPDEDGIGIDYFKSENLIISIGFTTDFSAQVPNTQTNLSISKW